MLYDSVFDADAFADVNIFTILVAHVINSALLRKIADQFLGQLWRQF